MQSIFVCYNVLGGARALKSFGETVMGLKFVDGHNWPRFVSLIGYGIRSP